jgi:hypothetical protein
MSPISRPIPRKAAATTETIGTGAGEIAAVRDVEGVAALGVREVRVVPAALKVLGVRAARVVPAAEAPVAPVAFEEAADATASSVDPPRGTFQQPGLDG